MARPRQLVATAGNKRLLFEIISTLAALIFLATGIFVLYSSPETGHNLADFIAILICVFGLYGTVMGILEIRDHLRQRPPHAPAR